jgi:predicted small lipoprotein YifL
MNRKFPQIAALSSVLALSGALAGCGKLGSLERPGPMFGAARAGAQPRQMQDPNRPVQTIDPRNQFTNEFTSPVPPRVDPIPGQAPDPFAVAEPQGALPDPFADPPQ